MKSAIISRSYFNAMHRNYAPKYFDRINSNPDNVYRTGYERVLNLIPIIYGPNDPAKKYKLEYAGGIIAALADELVKQPWVLQNFPPEGRGMPTREILAIDDVTGAMIVLCRWNPIATPIHGHAHGHMIDFLVSGQAKEIEYELTDPIMRTVEKTRESAIFLPMSTLSNDYNPESEASLGSLIHKFIPLTRCVTLHLIPELPRDGRGNLFNEPKTEAA